MATKADTISDLISPLKIEVEDDENNSGSSIIAPEKLIGVEEKVVSTFISPLETTKTSASIEKMQIENGTDIADVHVVLESIVKSFEGENFLKSPSVSDGEVGQDTKENQLKSIEKMNDLQNESFKGEDDSQDKITESPLAEKVEDEVDKTEISKQESDHGVKDTVEENLKDKTEALMTECEHENVQMLMTEVSKEIEITTPSESLDQIQEKEDETTISGDSKVLATPEEENLATFDSNEKNGAAEVAVTDKNVDYSNATSPLVEEEVQIISENPNQISKLEAEHQVLEVSDRSEGDQEGNSFNEVIQTAKPFEENADNKIIKEEKIEVEDEEQNSEDSEIAPEDLIGLKEKVESSLVQPLETKNTFAPRENLQVENITDIDNVHVVDEGIVKAVEGENFFKSPSVSDGEVESITKENQLNFIEEINGSQNGDKIDMKTDEDNPKPASEPSNLSQGITFDIEKVKDVCPLEVNREDSLTSEATLSQQDPTETNSKGEDDCQDKSSESHLTEKVDDGVDKIEISKQESDLVVKDIGEDDLNDTPEAEIIPTSETPDQIPASEDEKTISGDNKVLETPEEKNLVAIDLDEINGEPEITVTDKSGDDSNATTPLLKEEVQKLEQIIKEEEFEEPEITNKNIDYSNATSPPEAEITLTSETPDQIPAKEDEITMSGDNRVLETSEEKNLVAIDLDKINGEPEVTVTDKSGDDSNTTTPLLEEEVQKLEQIIKEEEVEEPEITNKREKIEEDVKYETVTEHMTECNREDSTHCSQENETVAKFGDREEPDELSIEMSKQESDHVVKHLVKDNLEDKPEPLATECKHETVDTTVTKVRDLNETPEHEESLELEHSFTHENELVSKNVEVIGTEVSGEIETTFLSETPDQIPAKEDEKTISGDYEVLATPKEMNLTAIDFDEKNGAREDAMAENNGNDSNDTSPLVEEEVQIISEKLEQIEKEEIFEEPEITNKREKIEEGAENIEEKTDAENIEAERLEVPAAESESFAHNVEEIHETDTSSDVGNTKTSEVEKAIREEPGVIDQESEDPSTLEEPEIKIGDDTEKSEEVSSLVSQVLTEETCDEKMENTKNYAEKADIEVQQTIDPLVETSIVKSQLPEHEIENEDLERAKILDAEPESDVQNVQDVYETTTSPSVEESGAIEIEKIIREVPEKQSEESGGSETKIQTEDAKGLESSDANSNSADQKIEEIHESKASTCESKNEEVSENNETKSSESDSKPDFPDIEEIKEIDQDPIAEQLPAEEEKEEFNPVSEIADTYEDEFEEEKNSELVPEPKVHSVEIESKPPAEETQGGKEDEETQDVPETVSEPKAQNVEEVNYKSIDEVKEETLSEFIPEPKVQSAEKIESEQPAEETQAGEEIEETKNVHETVSEHKARDVEEVNGTSIDMGSSKADEFSKLNSEASEAFSEPTKHVVEGVRNDDFVTPTVVNELTISKEFQLNDDSKNVFDSVSSIESIETAKKAEQHEEIEKIFLEDASTAVSDNVHEDEESEKESAKVDEEIVEANTTFTLSEHKDQVVEDSRGTHLGSALDESNIKEIAKVKEAPEELPEAINEEEDKITDKIETGFTNPDADDIREETFSELPEPKVQSVEEINEIESKLSVKEFQSGKESEEIKDGPEAVSELKAQNVEEVNETSRDLGSSKADQVEKLNKETPVVFSDPINQVVVTGSNDDFVTPIVATELTSSNEFQLNDEPANVNDSVSSADNIETTEKADSSQQDQGIEKTVLEDDSTAVSDNVHEDEERESETAKVDDEIKEAGATVTISEHKDKIVEDARETDPSLALKESNINEIAKVKEILEELPKAINEDAEAGSKAFAEQEIMESDAKDVQEAKVYEALIQPKAISVEKMDEFDPTPVVGKTPINEEKEEIEAVSQSVPEINFQGVNFNHTLPTERGEQLMEPSSTLAKDQHHESTTEVDMVKFESANKNDPRLNEADSLETGTTGNVVTRELENSNLDLIVEDTRDKATKEIDEESKEATTKCDEDIDIAATTGIDVTLMGESELINEPMKAFSTISKTTTPETIELNRNSEVDAIQLEETSIVESQLQEHENETETDVCTSSTTEKTDAENAEVEKSEIPAAEYESYENETPLNGDTADSLEIFTTKNVAPRELEISNSDLIVEDTGDKATVKEIDEESKEVTTKCDESIDIAATTGTDVTLMGESELINEPMEAFSTISKTTTPETIELIRNSEVDAIQLEETSIVESQLQKHENETDVYASSTTEKTDAENAEVEKWEVPAAEYESYESETPLNEDTADSLEICTTENVAPRELEISNSDLIVEDTENKATEKKIDEENIAATTKCDEGTDIAATTAIEATHLGESELINHPINAFVTSSETTCSKTVDTPEVDEIKLEEISTVESQLLADENETEACVVFVTEKTDAENIEAERLEVPAAESESFAHNVEDIHETDTSPDVGDTKTSKVEKAIREEPGVIDQVYEGGNSDELFHCQKIQAENKEEQVQASSFVFLSDEEIHQSRAITLENMEDGNMKKDNTEEDNLKPQEDYGVDSLIQNIETVEELDKDEVKAEESTGIALNESRDHLEEIHKTKASSNVDISGPDGREKEIKSVTETSTTLDVEAVIDDEANEQPLAIGELEEHQESSSVFLSEKKDESEESEISGTKTEANVLGVEEVHETETTAAVEKTNADKVEDETKEALETIPEPKCQDVGVITDRGILSDQNLPLEARESAKDGVTETGIAPRPASNVTSIEDIELIDEAAKVIDTGSETNKPETIDTESEVIGIEGEKEYVVVGETDTIQSEKVLPEVPQRLPEGKNQGPEAVTNDEIDPTCMSQDENIKEDVSDSSFVFLSSEETHITTTINTEDDTSKLQETSGMLSQLQNKETIMSDADEVKAEEAKSSDKIYESKDQIEEIHETKATPTADNFDKVQMEEAVIDDVPSDESTRVSKCTTKKADLGENIEHSPGEVIVSKLIPEPKVLNVEESQTETSPNREEDETKTVPETTFGPDHEDAADIIARYIIINQTFPVENKEEIIKSGEETDINPIDEVVKAPDSSDTKIPETIQTADITELDSEIIKSQLQEHETEKIAHQSIAENVEEIHDTSTRQTVGESDANGSLNVFDVEETKGCSSIYESKDQAVEDVLDKGTSSTVRETGMKEGDQEARESLEIMTKEIYKDIGPVSKEEIASIRPTEGEKIEEKSVDTIPESKDINLIDTVQNEGKEQLNEPFSGLLKDQDQETVAEDAMNKNNASSNENIFDLSKEGTTVEKSSSYPVDEKCKEDFDLELEKSGKALQPESEILGSEVDHTPKETDIMNKHLEEPVTNMREIETQIENTTEAAQPTHESTSKELLTEEPEKAEENNTLKEPITADNIDANYEKIENDEKNVENESENLATETTMPIKEVKSLEVTMGKPEDKLGAYSDKDETAITNIDNFESQENDAKESEGIEEQEANVNASEFPSSKTTSDGELENKGENMVDEKQRNFILDPVSIIPRTEEQVEKLGMLPTAKDQEAIRDVTEPKELIKEPEEEDKISLSQSQEQFARKEYLNEEKEDKNAIASRDFQVNREDPTSAKQAEDFEEGKHGKESPEKIEKITPKDPAQVTEEPKTEAEERVLVEEDKTDEEEENEHKKASSESDAPVMVEASKDIDVKTPNKKSHGILSGVGSKVKHSIAKVKKAITGKSSSQKSSSPKADKKTETVPLL